MSYFDLTITQIPIGWPYKPQMNLLNDKLVLSAPVQVEQHDLDWWLEKWRVFESDGATTGDLCRIKFTDNGDCGDGITATIFAGDESSEIASFGIPDESLGTLIASLTAIQKLRKSQSV